MKKQPLLILSVFTLVLSLFASCSDSCEKGSGKAASEIRKVASYTKLNFSGAYKVVLQQGSPSVKITADDNLLKVIQTDVSGDELKVSTKGQICTKAPMEVYITNPDFQAVKSTGALDLSANGKLNLKDFDMEFGGASKVNLDFNAANVKTVTSGTADINLTGQATENLVTMSGAGNLNAVDFVVANYRVETSGLSHCKINVLKELSVNVSGAGSVEYKGNPTKINNQHSGMTSIKKID